MIGTVHILPRVPFVPLGDRRQLVAEVKNNGAGTVFDNRASRAEIYRRLGDEEFAQRAEREAQFVLDVYA